MHFFASKRISPQILPLFDLLRFLQPVQIIRRLDLYFSDPELEAAFRADNFEKAITPMRIGLLVGLFLYAVFGVLDTFVIPDARDIAWVIRFLVVCPMITAAFIFTFSRSFRRWSQPVVGGTGYMAGLGIVIMCAVADIPGSYLYYAGLLLSSTFYFTFFHLRFVTASLVGWLVFLTYVVAALWIAPIPHVVFFNNTFFFLSFNVTGMAVCLTLERLRRKDFLQRQIIQDQTHQLRRAMREIDARRLSAEEASRRDPLTGLYNRRYFFTLAPAITTERAMLVIDLDHFKKINDTYGHTVGDSVLIQVAQAIRQEFCETDVVCRYGGEEFAVLLVGITESAARAVGQRLLHHLRALRVDTGRDTTCISASIGLAAARSGDPASLSLLLEHADAALYVAKQAGRDRLVVWKEDISA